MSNVKLISATEFDSVGYGTLHKTKTLMSRKKDYVERMQALNRDKKDQDTKYLQMKKECSISIRWDTSNVTMSQMLDLALDTLQVEINNHIIRPLGPKRIKELAIGGDVLQSKNTAGEVTDLFVIKNGVCKVSIKKWLNRESRRATVNNVEKSKRLVDKMTREEKIQSLVQQYGFSEAEAVKAVDK